MEQILLIEDEPAVRETLKDILDFAGYRVLIACNGKEGYDIITAKEPDLVLCDVNMPKLNGFELLEVINQRFKDEIVPPFLFLTAKVESESLRYGMSLGADDYIFKPFTAKDILQTIRLRLDRRKLLLGQETIDKKEAIVTEVNKIALPSSDGLDLILFDNIIKCQADRSYCNFHLVDKRVILVAKPMKNFEEILSSKNFFKVHKSIIVNMKHVEKFARGKSGYLVMSDKSIVNVSIRKKEELTRLLKVNI